jgi:hypothetical protein
MEPVPRDWRAGSALLASGDAMKTLAIVFGTMAATVVIQRLVVLVLIAWEVYSHDVASFLRGFGGWRGRLRVRGRGASRLHHKEG